MKIQHIKLGWMEYILVVDGVRGPLCCGNPTHHPAGVVAFGDGIYNMHPSLQNKVFVLTDDVEQIDDSACDAAKEAFAQYTEVKKTCTEVKLSRYGAEGA